MSKRFLALIGSPRPRGTSAHLAQYLVDGLAARAWQAQALTACTAIRQPEQWPALAEAYLQADALAVTAPLYVDSLPAELTLALERLAHLRRERSGQLLSVLNCGFAEAHQNDAALSLCRLFARDAGWRWAGGLAIGGGSMFAARPLGAQGRNARHITTALDAAVTALDAGNELPASAISGIRVPPIPRWLYYVMADLSMRLGALTHGQLLRMGARPYGPRRASAHRP